ncbi:MAG: two-component system sensor histidine kinase NtrB [Succinivibrionaceae bacterium]|nr:two-component system sensor histidine kinase NtrB [Succinivibrionaceae bacterium]
MANPAQLTLDSMTTAVLVTGMDLGIRGANLAAQQMFMFSRRRLLSMRLPDLIDMGDAYVMDSIRSCLDGQETGFSAGDVAALTEPGKEIRIDLSVSRLEGTGLVVEARDPSYRQRLSSEVKQRHQHLAARDLVRSLAHEIKNPLGGIRGAAQLIEMTFGKAAPGIGEYTSVIIEQTDRLAALVNRLLGPQRANPMETASIHYVTQKVLSLLGMETQGKISIRRDYDPSLPDLPLDVDGMQQALLNILRNACQALTESGTSAPLITIKTRACLGAVINGIKHPTAIALSVTDNGPGIPDQIMETLFYPMVTTRHEGNGLGLSIAQSIIERHGGSIACHSAPGCTTFTVLLPLPQKPYPRN